MKKEHAQHNEQACSFLFKEGKYPDWVVTTAFYSALHYVQHDIFPTKIGLTFYNSFENYYNGNFRKEKNKPSKHQATINLVYDQIGEDIGDAYNWLHDACRTARYRNFKIDPRVSEASIARLEEIKSAMAK